MQTVLVNLLEFDPPRNGGVTNIVYVLSRLLVEQARQRKINVFFAVGWQTADSFRAWAGLPDAIVIPLLLAEGLIPPILKSLKPDLIISPMFGMDPVMAAIPEIAETPHIAVMPDTLSLDKPALFDFQDVTRRRKIYDLLRQADTVVTISQDARKRLIRHLDLDPTKVKVIPLAGDTPTFEPTDAAPITIPGPYIFYPANGWPHKRHSLLLQTMNEIWRTRPDLYLVLTGWHEPEYINKMFGKYNCRWDRLVDLGYVKSHAQVQSLYRNAEALLFVSHYEGFGMPLVEAMRNDCPIICAPVTSIPEVAGNAAIYIDSKDPRDWVRAFLQQIPARRSELIQNGREQADQFTWARTAQMWENLLAERNLFDVNLPSRADQNSVQGIPQLAPELQHWNSQHTSDIQDVAAMAQEVHTVKEFLKHPYRDYFLNRIPVLQKVSLWWQGVADKTSFWTDRVWKFTRPKLGILAHYPPSPITIRPHYFTPAHVDAANAPTISLVTPSFNQGMFLEKTISSLLEQNYPNLEYILQDGDSRDETVEIIEEYRSRFHHIESRKDKGQAQAINLGFSHASGEIMAYLNSDDFLMPDALQYVAAYFQSHPDVDVIYGHRIIVDENDGEIGRWILPPHEEVSMLWYDFIPQETLFWRRSIWEKAGGYIDESFQFALDWDLLIRFRQAGARFARVNRFLACFRVHGAQKTSLNMSGVGMDEINRIRQRIHGYVPSQKECDAKTAPYRWKSVLYYALNRFNFLKE